MLLSMSVQPKLPYRCRNGSFTHELRKDLELSNDSTTLPGIMQAELAQIIN